MPLVTGPVWGHSCPEAVAVVLLAGGSSGTGRSWAGGRSPGTPHPQEGLALLAAPSGLAPGGRAPGPGLWRVEPAHCREVGQPRASQGPSRGGRAPSRT